MEEMIRKAQRHLDDNCKWLEKQKKHLEEAEEKLKKKTAEIRK